MDEKRGKHGMKILFVMIIAVLLMVVVSVRVSAECSDWGNCPLWCWDCVRDPDPNDYDNECCSTCACEDSLRGPRMCCVNDQDSQTPLEGFAECSPVTAYLSNYECCEGNVVRDGRVRSSGYAIPNIFNQYYLTYEYHNDDECCPVGTKACEILSRSWVHYEEAGSIRNVDYPSQTYEFESLYLDRIQWTGACGDGPCELEYFENETGCYESKNIADPWTFDTAAGPITLDTIVTEKKFYECYGVGEHGYPGVEISQSCLHEGKDKCCWDECYDRTEKHCCTESGPGMMDPPTGNMCEHALCKGSVDGEPGDEDYEQCCDTDGNGISDTCCPAFDLAKIADPSLGTNTPYCVEATEWNDGTGGCELKEGIKENYYEHICAECRTDDDCIESYGSFDYKCCKQTGGGNKCYNATAESCCAHPKDFDCPWNSSVNREGRFVTGQGCFNIGNECCGDPCNKCGEHTFCEAVIPPGVTSLAYLRKIYPYTFSRPYANSISVRLADMMFDNHGYERTCWWGLDEYIESQEGAIKRQIEEQGLMFAELPDGHPLKEANTIVPKEDTAKGIRVKILPGITGGRGGWGFSTLITAFAWPSKILGFEGKFRGGLIVGQAFTKEAKEVEGRRTESQSQDANVDSSAGGGNWGPGAGGGGWGPGVGPGKPPVKPEPTPPGGGGGDISSGELGGGITAAGYVDYLIRVKDTNIWVGPYSRWTFYPESYKDPFEYGVSVTINDKMHLTIDPPQGGRDWAVGLYVPLEEVVKAVENAFKDVIKLLGGG